MGPQDTLAGCDLAETWIANKKKKLRLALYSHDTVGIGHMRRNLLIAQAIARKASEGNEPLILLVSGGREVCAFGLPAGTDCLTLPALTKEENGQYRARRWDMSLKELLNLRSRSIAASLRGFAPDVLIVDKVPRGALGELEQALQELHAQGETRFVLGLRDVLDDPVTVRQEWQETGAEEAIRHFYDAVWIYGDRRVFDPVAEYRFSREVAAKVSYTGYLAREESAGLAALSDGDLLPGLGEPVDDLVLCLVGGGQDGSQLAEIFAQTDFPAGTTGVILTGPFMPQQVQNRLQRQAQKNRQLRVLRFVTDPDLLLRQASRVVAMGGYNTICEIIAAHKPALIVPRVKPRQEQLIRAERMRDLGLVDLLHPKDLSARALKTWLVSHPGVVHPRGGSPGDIRCPIDLDGLDRLPRLLQKLLDSPPRSLADNVPDTRVPERSNPYACL
jgi:predicted glycosyltransferase